MLKLYDYPEFTRYCTINQIRKDTMRIACWVLKYKHIDKGTYLFHQGDTPDKFYGIIKGSISIRVLPHMRKEEMKKAKEVERIVLNQGTCFGEWALIYNSMRTASAFALEDVDLFYLDKEDFDITLNKEILKTDINKRYFVINKLPILKRNKKISTIIFAMVPCVRI